jgi:hypothetical protein
MLESSLDKLSDMKVKVLASELMSDICELLTPQWGADKIYKLLPARKALPCTERLELLLRPAVWLACRRRSYSSRRLRGWSRLSSASACPN